MLARLIARSVVAFGGSLGFPERNQRRDIRADQRLSVGESVIGCSPRALVGPGAVGPLVRGRNADHL